MNPILLSAAASLLIAAGTIPSSPELGKAEGKCRPQESGPAFIVNVQGLKDRRGKLKLEVYPANNSDFLADDNILVSAGKTFRRVEDTIPASGPVELCVRVPPPASSRSACSMTGTATASSTGAPTGSVLRAIRNCAGASPRLPRQAPWPAPARPRSRS